MNEELKRIVENMIQAGESESNIALVIQNFKPSKKKKEATTEDSQMVSEPSGENLGDVSSELSTSAQKQKLDSQYSTQPTVGEVIEAHGGKLPDDIDVVSKQKERPLGILASGYDPTAKTDKEKREIKKRAEDNQKAIYNQYKEDILEAEVEPTMYDDVFNNIADIQNEKLLGADFKDKVPVEESLPKVKIINDYAEYLKKSDSPFYDRYKEGALTKDDKKSYDFLNKAIVHQSDILKAKREKGIIDDETYNFYRDELYKKQMETQSIDPDAAAEYAAELISKKAKKGSDYYKFLYDNKVQELQDAAGFSDYEADLIEEKETQEEVDKSYKEALKNPYLPQNAAKIAYYNVVAPAMNAFKNYGANVIASSSRLSGVVQPDFMSKALNEYADDITDYFGKEGIYTIPSEMKGGLFEDGDIKYNKLLPKVSETMANMWALVGGGGYMGGTSKTAQNIGLISSSFLSTQNDYYKEAREQGLSHKQSMAFSSGAAATTSMLELVNPQKYLVGDGFKLSKNALRAIIKDKPKGAIKEMVKGVGEEILFENMQELSQEAGDMLNKFVFNAATGSDFDVSVSKDEILELVALTSIAAGGMKGVSGFSSSNQLRYEALENSVTNSNEFNEYLSSNEVVEALGEDKINSIKEQAGKFKGFYEKLPESLGDKRAIVATAKIDLEKLNERKKEIEAEEFQDIFKDELTAVNNEINVLKKNINNIVNDSETKEQVPSTERKGEATEQTEPIKEPSGEEVEAGGMVQKKQVKESEYAKSEIDRVKALPQENEDGATMNLDGSKYEGGGLVIPLASKNMDASELTPEAIDEFIAENSEAIGGDNVKVGIYKFPNSNQVSIDLNIVADPSMRAEALELGKELGQESLFDLDTFENIKTGADGKNPKTLSPKELLALQGKLSITESISIKKQNVNKLDEIEGRAKTSEQKKLVGTIKNVVKALTGVDSEAEIVIHESQESYNKAVKEAQDGESTDDASSGFFQDFGDGEGKIHINLSEGQSNTAFHEASHKVMSAYLKRNPEKLQEFKDKLDEVLTKEQKDSLDEFASEYSEEEMVDEFVTEALSRIANGDIKLPTEKSKLQPIIDFLNDIAYAIGLKKIKLTGKEDVIDFANKLSEAFNKGREISISEKIDSSAKPTGKKIDTKISFHKKIKLGENVNLERHKNIEKSINMDTPLSMFKDKVMHITFSDRLVTGFINGKEYKGGLLYPALTNAIWAANGMQSAKKIQKSMVKNDDGYSYLALGVMSETSHMSNNDMSALAIEKVEDVIKNNKVPVSEAEKRIKAAFNRTPLAKFTDEFNSKSPKTTKGLLSIIDETILSDRATFDERKAFLETVLGKANIDKSKRFGGLPSYNDLAKELEEPITRNMNIGDVGIIVRTKGDVGIKETKEGDKEYHPSYKFALTSTDDVEVYMLDNIYNAADLFPFISRKGIGIEDYKKKYGDSWRMRYNNYLGIGKMSTTVSEGISIPNETTSEEIKNAGLEGLSTMPVEKKSKVKKQKKVKKGDDLVDNYGSTSKGEMGTKMTKDSDGNYLFFHYSGANFKGSKIDPKHFGKNSYTTDKRMHKVSFYYTNPLDRESMVGVAAKPKVVRVSPDKVYPLQSDPLSYMDEAEALFREDFGEYAAFDSHWQASYIGKVALDNGFEMLVSDWGGAVETEEALRGESQISHKFNEGIPEDAVQAKTGEFIVKEEVNDDLGMDIEQSIIDWAKKEYEGEYNPFKQIGSWGVKEFFNNNPELLDEIPSSIKKQISKPKIKQQKKRVSRVTQKKIDEVVEGKGKGEKKTINTWNEFKRELRKEEENRKKGIKIEKERIKELKNSFKSWLNDWSSEIQKTDAKITKGLLDAVNSMNENNMWKVALKISEVIEIADIKKSERIAKSIQGKINKASKKAPRNLKAFGVAIKKINPRWVDANELALVANEYIEAVKGGGGISPELLSKVEALKEEENKRYSDYYNDKLRESYELSGVEEDGISFDEYKKLMDLDQQINAEQSDEILLDTKSKNRENLERVIKWRLDEVNNYLESNRNFLSDKEIQTLETFLTIKFGKDTDTSKSISIDNFTSQELKELNNVITEIVTFNEFNGTESIESAIEGKRRANSVLKRAIPVIFSKLAEKFWNPNLSFNNLFKAIAGGEGGKALRNIFVAKLNEFSNIAKRKSDIFNVKIDSLLRNISTSKAEQDKASTRIGMASFLIQNESDMIGNEIDEDFKSKKRLIELEIEKMEALSKNKSESASRKRGLEKTLKMYKEAYNSLVKNANSKDDIYDALSNEEKELYDYAVSMFEEIKEDLKNSHYRNSSKEFIEFEQYIPTEQRNMFYSKDKELEGYDSANSNINTKQAGTTIKRVKSPTKNPDGTFNDKATVDQITSIHVFNFNNTVKGKYYESLYDIGTIRERKVLNAMINSKAMKKYFNPDGGSNDLHNMIRDRVADKINLQKNGWHDPFKEANMIEKVAYGTIRKVKSTLLKTVDQWIKQPSAIIAQTIVQVGGTYSLKASEQGLRSLFSNEYTAAFNKLIESSEVANRVTMGEYLYEDTNSLIESALKRGKLDDNKVAKLYIKNFENALSQADKHATRLSWLAAYIKEAKKNGTIDSVSGFDLIEHTESGKIDLDAVHKADNTSQEINNYSDFSDAPPIMTKNNYKFWREMVYSFRSFSINMWVNNLIALRDIVSSGDLEVNKGESARLMAGSMAAVVAFQGAKEFAVNPLWDLLLDAIFGVDDDKDEVLDRVNKVLWNALADYMVGGAYGGEFTDESFKQIVNAIYDLSKSSKKNSRVSRDSSRKKSEKDKKPYYVGRDGSKLPSVMGTSLEFYGDAIESGYKILDGTSEESDEYEMYKFLAFMANEGTLERFFSKAASRKRKQEKSTSSY